MSDLNPSPSMHLTGPFTTCAIKSQPANVISFQTNFRARNFRSILMLRYATSNPPRCYSFRLLDFAFFAARCIGARDVANEPTLLGPAGKKYQREIRIVHANANKRRNIGISMYLSEMRQKNESLHDMHRSVSYSLISVKTRLLRQMLYLLDSELLYPNKTSKLKML